MDSKTRGIIIRNIKYGESSAISHIYTEAFGLLSFHVQGVYKNKGVVRLSHIQPMNTVEISLQYKKQLQMQRIKDISCQSYPQLQNFSQQAFYHVCCEILQQTIKENELNQALFDYLYEEALPALSTDIHFWQLPFFMLNILHYYGCAPNGDTYSENAYLDLQNGVFLDHLLPLRSIANPSCSALIYQILQKGIAHLPHNPELRQEVIEALLLYFKWHVNANFELKSREILWGMQA